MKELADLAIDTAQARGATYADVRVVERQEQTVGVKNGVVEALSETGDRGFGVRVIAEGAWGFASGAVLSGHEVERVAALAVEVARASGLEEMIATTERGLYITRFWYTRIVCNLHAAVNTPQRRSL